MFPASGSEFAFVYFSSIGKRRYHNRNTLQTRKSPSELLVIVVEGKGNLYTEQQLIPIKPGQCIWLMPNQTFEVLQESDIIEVYLLAVRKLIVARSKRNWRCSPQAAKPSEKLSSVMMRPLLKDVERLYEESRNASVDDPGLQRRFQNLICEINERFATQREVEETAVGIERTLNYMHKHYNEKIKLETLSALIGLTPSSFSRSFKKAKNMSPVEYLNQIRIDTAKRLLEDPRCSVKVAASAVGMGSEFYFSRMFKKSVGLSPTLYIKRKQLKVATATCFGYKECLHSLGVEDAFELGGYLSMRTVEDKRHVEFKLEQMREYGPDIILTDVRHMPFYEQLKQIAPTVVVRLSMDWRMAYMHLAELIGREAEARCNTLQLTARVRAARDRLSHTIGNRTISLIRLQDGKIRLQGKSDHPLNNLLYTELGLQPGSWVPRNLRDKEVTPESLAAFGTDYLLVYEDSPADSQLLQSVIQQSATDAQSLKMHLIPNWIRMSWVPSGQHQIIDSLEQWED
ncbi:helix-turn-helix domain-containing protein [Paenibacillus sp. CGMCC 1.16610]|uniref:Helix-turn-helix domain-containing protein n=1 Tax=Paenibacillus anseongense TaxID=2682845 RepID=A0ABW9UGL4_9BACL|nr:MULTISPECIES: helix-turn-helix domain-containing protein [Paenibacillus]MBA2942833.1 helix-turn-helix domain-containing protein [Paenibacillus sp. CGMCC 1.16610]MVQ38318.1 helix-turn-helix domain-containing protein [Paenibacillus anseongense]